MCLISTKKSPHRLKRDMRCWKVVLSFPNEDTLKPIYWDGSATYRLGETHVEMCSLKAHKSLAFTGMYECGVGFVHAFRKLDNAKILLHQCKDVFYPDGRTAVVCECTIPAGTEVYSNRKEGEVCARAIRFDKVI